MRVVIVKHESCGTKYLFQVPEPYSFLTGDLVSVKTRKGTNTMATCLSPSFEIDENSERFKGLCAAMGAPIPLSPIVGYYYYVGIEPKEEERIVDF